MSDSYLLIIDGSSLLSTQYYGNLPRQILYAKTTEEKEKYYDKIMSTRSGVYTNGVYGFLRTLLKIINENKPSHLAVCWDLTRDTFRRKLYADYKATRSETPKPLSSQFALMQEVLRRIGAAQFMDETYEADDFAGTLSHRFSPEIDVKILTKDRDYLQLVNEKTHVWMVQSSEEKTEEAFRKYKIRKEDANVPDKTLELDEALTKAEYEIEPRFVTSLKALEGDPSDNIPGVPGIGHQTAVKLVNAYGDVEALYDELHRIKDIGEDTLKARWKNELGITRPPLGALLKTDPDSLVGEEAAMLSKQLATISFDAPIGAIGLSDLKLDLNTEELTKVLLELEMNSLLSFLGDSGKKEDFFPGYREISDDTEAVEFFRSRKKAAVLGVSYLAGAGLAVSDGSETVFLREFFLLTREFFAEALKKAAEEGTVVSSFSGKELVKAFGIVTYDLSIASYLLEPLSNQYSPERIAQENLNVTLSAEEGEEQSALYAFAAAKLAPILLKKLEEQSMRDLYETIELPTMKALAELEETGIRVDEKALSDFSAVLKAKIDVLSEEIYALAGEQFNINSPKQLASVLFEKLAIPYGKKPKNGYSTSADVLERFRADYPIVDKVLEYRTYTKLRSTYAEGLQEFISEDHRIHGVFHQTVTATGRISSSDPNLQNIPVRTELGQEFRKVFVPEEGSVLIDADYSQIELRVLASLSGDENLIRAFLSETDIHTLTASQVFRVPVQEVSKDLRRKAKAVNFGIVYGISAYSLSEDFGVSVKEAEEYMEKYFESYPDVRRYLDETIAFAKENGYVKTLYGRIRPIPELSSDHYALRQFGVRVAMNSPIQGTAADIMKIAVIRVNDALRKAGLRTKTVLQIHDEILLEAPLSEADEAEAILVREMESASDLKAPLKAEANRGRSWYEAK